MITLGVTSLFSYLAYFSTDIVLLLIAGYTYMKLTPLDEMALISDGNAAAATMLAGSMIGFGLVFYSTITHGQGLLDTVVWSVVSLITQILAFHILRAILGFLHDDWQTKIASGDMAHGIFFGAFSLTIGIINAACVT